MKELREKLNTFLTERPMPEEAGLQVMGATTWQDMGQPLIQVARDPQTDTWRWRGQIRRKNHKGEWTDQIIHGPRSYDLRWTAIRGAKKAWRKSLKEEKKDRSSLDGWETVSGVDPYRRPEARNPGLRINHVTHWGL